MSSVPQIDTALKLLLDREVWIVTAATPQGRAGLLATWVSPVSIDPARPMLLTGLAPNHHTARLAKESGAFAAHLLRQDQAQLAYQFAASSGPAPDKFAGVKVAAGITGSPVLHECAAWFECRIMAQYDAGDRWFFWADVVSANVLSEAPVMREQGFFRQLSADQKAALKAGLQADTELQKPLHQTWRELQQGGMPLAPLNLDR